jgi:hypothetical protein
LYSDYDGNTIESNILQTIAKEIIMAKGRDSRKAVKKKSEKSLKEKRKEKKAKKNKK